jgi:hypothetical protein
MSHQTDLLRSIGEDLDELFKGHFTDLLPRTNWIVNFGISDVWRILHSIFVAKQPVLQPRSSLNFSPRLIQSDDTQRNEKYDRHHITIELYRLPDFSRGITKDDLFTRV